MIGRLLPDDVVLIGGIAVYCHTVDGGLTEIAETSHDVDFLVSQMGLGELRDCFQVLRNERLGKHQFLEGGIEFDVYVEHLHRLPVSYEEALAHSVIKMGQRVLCLEHLVALKLRAALDREGSAKGQKDQRDLARLGLLGDLRPELLEPHLTEDGKGLLQRVGTSAATFRSLSPDGDHQQASVWQKRYRAHLNRVVGTGAEHRPFRR